MKKRIGFPAVLFYGLAILMIVLTLGSFISAVQWINKPFAGFLIYDFPHVGSMGDRQWPGIKAGLRLMDRIISIDGEPVLKGRNVVKMIGQKKPGTLIHLEVESKGQIQKKTIPVTLFSLKDFLLVFFIPFLGGFALYVLGVIVYLLKPNISTSWVFNILCFSLGTYMVTGFEMQSSYAFVHLHFLIQHYHP